MLRELGLAGGGGWLGGGGGTAARKTESVCMLLHPNAADQFSFT